MLNPEDFDRPQLASILETIATLISQYNPRQEKAATHPKKTYLDLITLQEQDLVGLAGSIVRALSMPEDTRALLKRRSEILSQPSVSLNDEIELQSIAMIYRSTKLIEREQQQ